MRKKIIFASAVSCLFLSSANASVIDKPNGWYLKGAYENLLASKRYNNLSAIGGALGYKQGYFRGEGSLSYGRIHQSWCSYNYCLKQWGNNFNLGLHGFLDFDNQTMISPYVGLGLEKNTWSGFYKLPHTQNIQPVGMVGARAYLSKNMALDVGYKTNLNYMGNGGVASVGLAWHFD